jgi:hypothetical protein
MNMLQHLNVSIETSKKHNCKITKITRLRESNP